jgi:hypothetical protein
MSADTTGLTAQLAANAAANKAPTYPHTGGPMGGASVGTQGTAMQPVIVQGQVGTPASWISLPRSLAFGTVGTPGLQA